MCNDEIGLCAKNIWIVLGSIFNRIESAYMLTSRERTNEHRHSATSLLDTPPFQNDCPTSQIFVLKWLSDLSAHLEIETQNQIFLRHTSYIKKSFDAAMSGGVSE